ncbi:MAG: heavy-metal-associated domain-containing protein, partial [Candidatus Paceibacteria bacterium]
MEKKYKFHVNGMHCNSCVLLIEESINAIPNVTKAKASLNGHTLEVSGDFGDLTPREIANLFTDQIKDSVYTVSLENKKHDVSWSEFQFAIPIALIFTTLFILLQKTGLVNLTSGSGVNYGTAFVVGIIASLSTCMAVVGGLVLS